MQASCCKPVVKGGQELWEYEAVGSDSFSFRVAIYLLAASIVQAEFSFLSELLQQAVASSKTTTHDYHN